MLVLFRYLATIALLTSVIAAPGFNGSHLFPIRVASGWTTAPESITGIPAGIQRLPFSNDSLKISSQSWPGQKRSEAPDGTLSEEAFFPKGSYSKAPGGIGGFGYYFDGPLDVTKADQVLFSYAVYFPQDFDFVLGGKLPGTYGGANASIAKGCSGGRQEARDYCWSDRIMWRVDGDGENYVYLPLVPENNPGLLVLKGSFADPGIYGFSIASGAFRFKRGGWTVISQRIQLNTFGQANGEIELWVDGKSVVHATGVIIRAAETTQIRGFIAETFFGGSNSSWASPKDQNLWITAYSAAILESGASPAQGHAAYPLRESDTSNPDPEAGADKPDAVAHVRAPFAFGLFLAASLVCLL